MSEELSIRQKLALLDEGEWTQVRANYLFGEMVRCIHVPWFDKMSAARSFVQCGQVDMSLRLYQVAPLPDYENDHEAINRLLQKFKIEIDGPHGAFMAAKDKVDVITSVFKTFFFGPYEVSK